MKIQAQRDALTKMLTGIRGFDEITDGGLPRGRTTLVMVSATELVDTDRAVLRKMRHADDEVCVVKRRPRGSKAGRGVSANGQAK